MPKRFLSLTSLLLIVGVSSVCHAQDVMVDAQSNKTYHLQYFIGMYAGLGINFHTSGFGQLPGFPSCCQEYKDNTSLSPVFDALIEIPLARDLRLQGRLGYAGLGGSLATQQEIGNEPVLDDGPVPSPARHDVMVEHTLDASIPLLVFEPTLGYRVLDFFWISAGARVGYMMGASFDQAERLYSPEGYTFLDGSTVRNQAAGDIPNPNSIQLHGVLGLGYELLTKSRMSLVPEVRYYLPFTQVAKDIDWTVQSFQIGVSVRYGIYAPNDPRIYRDTVYTRDTTIVERPNLRNDNIFLSGTEESEESRDEGDNRFVTTTIHEKYTREIPRPFKPEVRVDFFRSDGNMRADSVRVEELDVIENYPLLPQIFFAHGSASMDSTSQLRLEGEQARDFRMVDLQRDQLDVYKNLLNIVGYRMKQSPTANLMITGCVDNADDEKNNRELAKQRAESVKQYLVDSWGIDATRIKTGARGLPSSPANPTTEDGNQENRRTELASDDPSILEPVEFRDRDLIVEPKQFVLTPNIKNGQDIASWDATIKQGATDLYSSSGIGEPTPVNWNADTNGSRPKNDKPVVGTLSVRNEIGQSYTSTDTLDVDYVNLQLMKSSEEGGKLIERYSLIVFEFNSAQLNPSNQRVMERVKGRIQPSSKVKIVGFADRQGNPEYNRTLARRRCEEAQRVLGLPNDRVVIEPVGSDQLLYDNNIPEGRSYSRTVHIEIETPIR